MKNIPVRKINAEKYGSPSDTFSIRKIDGLLATSDLIQEIHRHDFFFILALENGKGDHMIDFVPYSITNHSVFFLRPGQVHELKLKKGSTGYLAEFSNDFLAPHQLSNQWLRSVTSKNHYPLSTERFKKIDALLSTILQEHLDKQEKYREAINANLEIFFIEMLRCRKSESAKSTENSALQDRLEEFLSLLETHVTNHKQVSTYAEMMNLSSYQLNAATKIALGKTASELINDEIILESKRQLLATPNQIKEIAYLMGYEDISYFTRFFRKQTGYSPEAFRQKFK